MFSMCSELTPRAPIPDTRIPQLMQPWGGGKTQMMTKPSTKEFKFAVRLTILGNLIIVVILIFIFIFFKVEQSKYLDSADICWV